MRKLLLLLIVVSVSAPGASAGQREYVRPSAKAIPRKACTPLRLRSDALGEPRRQTNSPWCYAFMSADLLSWELGERVSAADTALLYNDFENTRQRARKGLLHSEMRRGGDPGEAIDIVLRRGACLERDLPSQDYLVPIGGGRGEEIELLTMIAGIERTKREFDRSKRWDVPCERFDAFREVFPWLQWEDVRELIEKASEKEFVTRLQGASCDPRRKPFVDGLRSVTVSGHPAHRLDDPALQAALIRRIDELLEEGRLPGLGVGADLVGASPDESDHAVSFAGRRLNPKTGACEYLMRDSNDFCDPRLFVCEADGDRWVSEDHLKGKLKWVFYIDRMPR